MPLPRQLRDAIAAQGSSKDVARAGAELSDAYRRGEFAAAPLKSPAHRLAYLQVRMPATYAACSHVFEKTRKQMPDFAPNSLLDLGAGPGTAAWAAIEHFPSLAKLTLVERDTELLRLGQSLAANSPLAHAQWHQADLRSYTPDPYDLIVLSYTLGELPPSDARRILTSAWKAAQLLVIIEPGTPKAFARLADVRKQLIADGATIPAPCPHENDCPLLVKGDWCHFAERLERTAEHRRIKGGSLGYEDEKFSYVAATRLPIAPRTGRIVRHPQIHSGYVQLQVCAPEVLKQQTVTKSQKEIYRAARKSKWGDRWPS
ncbi:MAG TPA: small ribosomal subunit Rsm22 family protein [Candidatus Koribacter sp.]|jgi:ribosomal protein RSM22 (predicted rRNA methylase)